VSETFLKTEVARRRHTALVGAAAACVLLFGSGSVADELVIDGVNHAHVRITGLADGYLAFRTAMGEAQTARIDTVDLIVVERASTFADFNQAERLVAGGEPAKAISRYRRMVHTSESFWSDLLAARLLRASDLAGQIDRAAGFFVRTTEGKFSGPATAVHLMPTMVPDRRDGKVVRAVENLSIPITKLPPGAARSLLMLFRYDLLRRMDDKRASVEAARVATLTIDESIGTERVYDILRFALKATLPQGATPEVLSGLDRAIRYCPESRLPDFLLLKGETLLSRASTREDVIRASWPFMRVVAHMPDDARAVDGLLGTAKALERIGSFDKAAALLTECLDHPKADEAKRRLASQALSRVQKKEQ